MGIRKCLGWIALARVDAMPLSSPGVERALTSGSWIRCVGWKYQVRSHRESTVSPLSTSGCSSAGPNLLSHASNAASFSWSSVSSIDHPCWDELAYRLLPCQALLLSSSLLIFSYSVIFHATFFVVRFPLPRPRKGLFAGFGIP